MTLYLVLVTDPCDDMSWLHGVYDTEDVAERGFANACRTIFGPDWETWLEAENRPARDPAGIPAKKVVEAVYGIVELSGPYTVRSEPVEPEDHLETPEWYRPLAKHGRRKSVPGTWRRSNRPQLPSLNELRVYLAHLPTGDLLARVQELEALGSEETDDEWEVRTLAVEILRARHRG